MIDWGAGSYELTAAQLLPAARAVVEAAAPRPGEHAVDVGCGSGSCALLAAERGARVTGIDPAARLREVAAAEAAARGLDAAFVAGEAAAIPLADGSADVVLSSFGAIFAPDAQAAIAEMARVTAPDGRIVLSAWLPQGTVREAVQVARQAFAAQAPPPPAPPFAWHDAAALTAAFAPHGFSVSLVEREIAFAAASPEAYVDAELHAHPMWVVGLATLSPSQVADVRARVLAVLAAGNEDPDAFRVTSRYVIATARRDAGAAASATTSGSAAA
jgi:SAM-dependent methyltransferase